MTAANLLSTGKTVACGGSGVFTCADGTCIPEEQKSNGYDNCHDGSDELASFYGVFAAYLSCIIYFKLLCVI